MKLNLCVICGVTENLEHHHINLKSNGGRSNPENMLTLCSEHHGAIHGLVKRANISDIGKKRWEKKRAAMREWAKLPMSQRFGGCDIYGKPYAEYTEQDETWARAGYPADARPLGMMT